VEEVLKNITTDSRLKESIYKELILKQWPEIVGEKLVYQTRPKKLKNKILFLSVSNPIWAQELNFIKDKLIKKINQTLKQKIVRDIRFQVNQTNHVTPMAIGEIPPTWHNVVIQPKEIKKIEVSLAAISDEKLKSQLKTILIKDKKLKTWRLNQGWRPCPYCQTLIPPQKTKCPWC